MVCEKIYENSEFSDPLIFRTGRFDLVDALHDYTKSLTLHGDDVLAHSNWELGESWLRQYGYVGVLTSTEVGY